MVFLFSSALLWIVTTVCFLGAWDHVAAVTTLPYWSWAFAGSVGAMLAGWLMRPLLHLPWLVLGFWLISTISFSDNLLPLMRGLVRGSSPAIPVPPNTLRVATLNCASSPEAASEVMKYQPDLLLLQESPVSNRLAQLAREWFGARASFIIGPDCAIVSRYELRPVNERLPVHYVRGILSLSNNRYVLVTSLRFTPPLGRIDLWNPAAWRDYLYDRRFRRRQMESVLPTEDAKTEMHIIGGDFNAPVRDGIYRMLRGYRDTHRAAGRRWGNTAINTLPLFRPDQIWVRGFVPQASFAFETRHSDHRIVVADVRVP